MRLVRFIDKADGIVFGRILDSGRCRILRGSPWQGFEETGRVVEVGQCLAPIEPVNIFCIGLNYRDHAAETGARLPDNPILFMKPTSAVTHPGCPIPLPASCTQGPEVDYEGELAVVVGRLAHNVKEEQALEFVYGYTCANDISARRWQKHSGGGQWVRGKSFDGFCPLGPVLVTADEIPDPQALRVRTLLNGQTMQDGNTADMIFPVARLIHLLSQDTTLLPGTLILTGTPAGVGFTRNPPVFLAAGDQVEIRIDSIGSLVNPVAGPIQGS
ncbi:MAG: fumarylacetoacetate hydrolase family protein [Gammaproteobacteria bacterium]|nr:fumarylacetoacetate hydrolase family protein [Gammaproteobacteria bacterium]